MLSFLAHLPRLPGASAALRAVQRTAALLLALAACSQGAALAAVPLDVVRIGGTGAGVGTMQRLAEAYVRQHPHLRFSVVPNMGSAGGIRAVLSGALQIGLSTRALTTAEVRAGAESVEYGRTPLVYAMADRSPVQGLSTRELADIYQGRRTHWGDGTRLRLLVRPKGHSHNELIASLSPALREALEASEQRKGLASMGTDQATADVLEKVPGAIGPSTLALIRSEGRTLKALALDGVTPTPESVADGSYPLAKRMMLVTGPQTPPAARAFVHYVRSAEGRKLLAKYGHAVD